MMVFRWFWVNQPLVTMVFYGWPPLVQRWNGYTPSLKSTSSIRYLFNPVYCKLYNILYSGVNALHRRFIIMITNSSTISATTIIRTWALFSSSPSSSSFHQRNHDNCQMSKCPFHHSTKKYKFHLLQERLNWS